MPVEGYLQGVVMGFEIPLQLVGGRRTPKRGGQGRLLIYVGGVPIKNSPAVGQVIADVTHSQKHVSWQPPLDCEVPCIDPAPFQQPGPDEPQGNV